MKTKHSSRTINITIKDLFIAACVFIALLIAAAYKLTVRCTVNGIVYDGYLGHTVIGTKNNKQMQKRWISNMPGDSKRFKIRAETTAIKNPSASDDVSGDGIFYVAETIILPDSLTTVGDQVFSNTHGLEFIIIPDSVTSIGRYAFANCSSLTAITLSENINEIPDYCFYSCSSLRSITISENVTVIGTCAFAGCISLKDINIHNHIPDSVTKISRNAFDGCRHLNKISVSSKTLIEENAFPPGTKIIRRPAAVQSK